MKCLGTLALLLVLSASTSQCTAKKVKIDFNPRFITAFFEQFVAITPRQLSTTESDLVILGKHIPVIITTATFKNRDMSWIGTIVASPWLEQHESLNIYVQHKDLHKAAQPAQTETTG